MRRIYVSAFQSMLFNDMLDAWIRQLVNPSQIWQVKLKTGPRPFWHDLSEEQAIHISATRLPLPCSRNNFPEDPAIAAAANLVMEKWGLAWHSLRIKKMDDVFFGKGTREASLRPNVGNCTIQPDDLNPGRRMARLAFELPRGSYATLVIKRLQAAVGERLVEESAVEEPTEETDA
jgi:tRNA pseudouridine13 synthase